MSFKDINMNKANVIQHIYLNEANAIQGYISG